MEPGKDKRGKKVKHRETFVVVDDSYTRAVAIRMRYIRTVVRMSEAFSNMNTGTSRKG